MRHDLDPHDKLCLCIAVIAGLIILIGVFMLIDNYSKYLYQQNVHGE